MTTTDPTTDTSAGPAAGSPPDAAALEAIVDAHLAGYAEPDAGRRSAHLTRAWAADGRLVDPPFEAVGPEGIAALTETVLTHFPGHTFRRTTAIDVHHTHARYGWELVAPDGSVAVAGTDVVDVAPDGRLQRVVGFFGELAPLAGGRS